MIPNENSPAKTSLDLSKINDKDTHRDVIITYLERGGEGIELTDKQKELLERWTFADELIRNNVGKKRREEIANMIKERFGVHRATAFTDIVNAEYVFSSSSPLNKKYLIGLRIEFLTKCIRNAELAKDFKAIAMLEKSLLGYIEMYPDITPSDKSQPMIFLLDNRKVDVPVSTEDAEAIVESFILNQPADE